MKKTALLLIIYLLITVSCVKASTHVYSEDEKFGLKDSDGTVYTKAEYKKLVKLGESAWIMQDGSKFGIISDEGRIIQEPKYTHAERILGKYVKLKKGELYGIYDEMGFDILPAEYSSIDLLYGGKFVTCKNYKYGIADLNGQIILDNIFDDIYMPDYQTLILVYGGDIYTVVRKDGEALEVPYDLLSINEAFDIKANEFINKPLTTTGYYGVTFTDYILKLFSSISPAYEQTIDELMFSQGADTVSVLVKFGWLPKFPFVYAKKYYKNVISPNNGPLNKLKTNLKQNIRQVN